jgi:hypothetical protein
MVTRMHISSPTHRIATVVAALAFGLSLVACDDGGVTQLEPDPTPEPEPEPEPEVPPAPPVFPLKEGDKLRLTSVGGRTEPCAIQGDCDRVIFAEFEIGEAVVDADSGHWKIDAAYLYRLDKAGTPLQAIEPLFLSGVAPFDLAAEGTTSGGTGSFLTDAAPNDTLNALGFPFFHFEPEYANERGSPYAVAADAFRSRLLEIDPDANIESQAAASTISGYFKDSLNATPQLHMVEVKYHKFGFACSWDERLIDWADGMSRQKSTFGNSVPLTATFGAVRLIRRLEGAAGPTEVTFNCSCFAQTCQATIDGENRCLDPADPDAAPTSALCTN